MWASVPHSKQGASRVAGAQQRRRGGARHAGRARAACSTTNPASAWRRRWWRDAPVPIRSSRPASPTRGNRPDAPSSTTMPADGTPRYDVQRRSTRQRLRNVRAPRGIRGGRPLCRGVLLRLRGHRILSSRTTGGIPHRVRRAAPSSSTKAAPRSVQSSPRRLYFGARNHLLAGHPRWTAGLAHPRRSRCEHRRSQRRACARAIASASRAKPRRNRPRRPGSLEGEVRIRRARALASPRERPPSRRRRFGEPRRSLGGGGSGAMGSPRVSA